MKAGTGNPYGGLRIPSAVVGKDSRILVFAEGRANGSDQANNDIVLTRSDDEGRTWTPVRCIADAGRDCFNNPCPVYDDETGALFVLFEKYPEGVTERNGKLRETGPASISVWVIESRDNGLTWTTPADITASTKSPAMRLLAGGPHNGIRLTQGPKKGRLLIPFNEAPKFGEWSVYAVFSDDHGRTWRRGAAPANRDGVPNETAIVELAGGDVMINARRWTGAGVRKVAVSKDGGETFGETVAEPALRCDGTQGSMLRYAFPDRPGAGGVSRIVYAGPGGPARRTNGTLHVSHDEGATWSPGCVVVPGKFAYSAMVRLSDGDIGLVYEPAGHTEILFTRVSVAAITPVTPDPKSPGRMRSDLRP